MNTYFCDVFPDGDVYIRGLCGADDYSSWKVIETPFWAENKYIDDEGRPIWKVLGEEVVYEPKEKSIEQKETGRIAEVDRRFTEELPKFMRSIMGDSEKGFEEIKNKYKEIDAEIKEAPKVGEIK